MLDEGAGARDALGIAAELEQLGADLWVGSGRDGSQLSVQAPRETFHQAMAMAADILARPLMADADWHRVQADRRTGVVQRRDQPEAVINVVSDRILFGDTHPYGQPIDGLERTIDALTLDDVRTFHRAHYHPAQATLVVTGDFDADSLRDKLDATLAGWNPGPAPAAPAFPPWPDAAAPGHRRPARRPAKRRASGRLGCEPAVARSPGDVDVERRAGGQLHQPPQLQPAREARLHLRGGVELRIPAQLRQLRGAIRGVQSTSRPLRCARC